MTHWSRIGKGYMETGSKAWIWRDFLPSESS